MSERQIKEIDDELERRIVFLFKVMNVKSDINIFEKDCKEKAVELYKNNPVFHGIVKSSYSRWLIK